MIEVNQSTTLVSEGAGVSMLADHSNMVLTGQTQEKTTELDSFSTLSEESVDAITSAPEIHRVTDDVPETTKVTHSTI